MTFGTYPCGRGDVVEGRVRGLNIRDTEEEFYCLYTGRNSCKNSEPLKEEGGDLGQVDCPMDSVGTDSNRDWTPLVYFMTSIGL